MTYAPMVTKRVGNQTELTDDGSTLIACNQLSSSVKVPIQGSQDVRDENGKVPSSVNPDLQRKPKSMHQHQDQQAVFQ